MPRRSSRTRDAAPPKATQLSAVQAIFDPAGEILVRAVAPSGTVYEIKPRISFKIADEDVAWFFYEWDWQWRQCLCRAEDYQPRQPQFDNGAANLKAHVEEPKRPQFDNGVANIVAAHVEEPKRPQFDNSGVVPSFEETVAPILEEPVASMLEEPVMEPENASDPVEVEVDNSDDEDKE